MINAELPLTPAVLTRHEEGCRRADETSEILFRRLEPLWREYADCVSRLPLESNGDPGRWPLRDVRFLYSRQSDDLRFVRVSGYVEAEDQEGSTDGPLWVYVVAHIPRILCGHPDAARKYLQSLRQRADGNDYARQRQSDLEASERATLARLLAKYGPPPISPPADASLSELLLWPLTERDKRKD